MRGPVFWIWRTGESGVGGSPLGSWEQYVEFVLFGTQWDRAAGVYSDGGSGEGKIPRGSGSIGSVPFGGDVLDRRF